jgi:hypothetical protein
MKDVLKLLKYMSLFVALVCLFILPLIPISKESAFVFVLMIVNTICYFFYKSRGI